MDFSTGLKHENGDSSKGTRQKRARNTPSCREFDGLSVETGFDAREPCFSVGKVLETFRVAEIVVTAGSPKTRKLARSCSEETGTNQDVRDIPPNAESRPLSTCVQLRLSFECFELLVIF